jgi:5-methylthioribose kinase
MDVELGNLVSEEVLNSSLDYPVTDIALRCDMSTYTITEATESTTAWTLRITDDSGRTVFAKVSSKSSEFPSALRRGLHEVDFYRSMNGPILSPPSNIPECISWHADTKRYLLVIEDLSMSHCRIEELEQPTIQTWRSAVTALAMFHSKYLGQLPIQFIDERLSSRTDVEGYLDRLTTAYSVFEDAFSARIERAFLDKLARALPILREIELDRCARIQDPVRTTIVHGDLHMGNVLLPRIQNDGSKLIDWQFWGIGSPTYDLRHLLGARFPSDMWKYRIELVRYYYETLISNANADYSWDQCWTDYRYGALDNLFMAVWQYTSFGWEYEKWINTLDSAIRVCDELDCFTLFD